MLGSLGQVELAGKRVFVRVDFDVALDEERAVKDDALIRACLPTLELLLEKDARLVVASHLGKPGGRRDDALSLEPAAARLADLLDLEVRLADDCVGDGVRKMLKEQKAGEVVVLENLHFRSGEEANDPDFARALAAHCDLYVDDAPGCAHHAWASNFGMVPHVAGPRVTGMAMRKELDAFGRLLSDPPRPFVAAFGGEKLSEKQRAIESLLPRLDALLIGGALAYTFLAARKASVGNSPVEASKIEAARTILERAEKHGVKVLLPSDHVCLPDGAGKAKKVVVEGEAVPEGMTGRDLGPKTAATFKVELARARTAFWNGPMGRFEDLRFAEGTRAVGRALGEVSGLSVACGADTAAAIHALRLSESVKHVSLAGEAGLQLVAGRALPAVTALEQE